jgi:hypothetical protein
VCSNFDSCDILNSQAPKIFSGLFIYFMVTLIVAVVVARVWYDLCHNPYYLTCYVFCLCLCLCAKVRKVCVCYCIFHAIQPLYRLLCKILLNYLLLLFLFNLRILSYMEALSISCVPWTTIMCILLQYKCEIMDICIATYRYTSNLQNIALWARTSISIYVWEIENKSHARGEC